MARAQTPLTSQIIETIAKNIHSLSPLTEAAWAAGVPERTFYRWWGRGREAHSAWQDAIDTQQDPPKETKLLALCHDLFIAVRSAQAKARVECAERVRKGNQGWQGSAWLLERTQQELYALRNKHEISGPGGGPISAATVSGEAAIQYLSRLLSAPDARDKARLNFGKDTTRGGNGTG